MDATGEGESFFALSEEPWLELGRELGLQPGAIMQIRFSSCIFDDSVRPVLRFFLKKGGFRDMIGPAPYCGAGIWIVRIPKDFREAWISPTNKSGPFSFRIDSVERVSLRILLRQAIDSPQRIFFAASARLVGLGEEADLNLRWALGHSKSEKYHLWASKRRGTIPPTPRADWSATPEIVLFLNLPRGDDERAKATCRSLRAQSYARWRLVIRQFDRNAPPSSFFEDDSRFVAALPADVAPNSLWGALRPGDELVEDALACFIEYFARNPGCAIAYADDVVTSAGGEQRLNAKPDWSPCLDRHAPYIGRAALWRRPLGDIGRSEPERPDDIVVKRLAQAERGQVGHIRRALFRFPAPSASPAKIVSRREASLVRTEPVTVIIPTRDGSALLRACLESVFASQLNPSDEILIIDNGSKEARTEALFGEYRSRRANLAILRQPGPFNFSALCNAAAAQASHDFMVFLNNDTEIRTPDWLDRLWSVARRSDVGAVGARLLFPRRTVQHQGVVLGLGGVAGHFGAQAPAEAPGWRSAGRAPHETSAVTAACLMIERRKFELVGGFDAENLPIDLNDVDLCLRLAQRGWRTICDARVELLHRESASRGSGAIRLQRVYARERAYFLQKWRAIVRDDPYFNPALSLYALDERLW
jgi:GT2 family glycosyltransferase